MRKIINLLRRRRMEQDLSRELAYHVTRRAQDLVQSGMSDAEARRQAALEFGGVTQVQEDVRQTWFGQRLDNIVRDVRYAARTLRRSPTFTAAAVLSLALGIGANAAIFSIMEQVLLRLLPVKDPQRLVLLDWKGNALADGWGSGNLMSYPMCRDIQEQRQFFDGVFCRHPTMVTLATGDQHRPVGGEIVTGSYFPVLGVRPELGRLIDESDDVKPGAHPVVVLSYDYWKSNLGGAPDVVGRSVLVNNNPMTVIGVAAAGFRGVDLGEAPAVWIPSMMKKQVTPEWDRLFDRRAFWMNVFGRLKPGVNAEQAKTGLAPWFKSVLEADTRREGFPPVTQEQRRDFLSATLDVLPAANGRSGLRSRLRAPLWVLMTGTALLLLLACVNVANLFLARGATRGREVTTRMALGASRSRITGQLLAEGLMVAFAGGLLGLVAAPLVSQALLSFLPPDEVWGTGLSSRMNRAVFAFAFLISVITGALCGLAPALQASRIPLIASLKERTHTGGVRLRKALVVGQLAFTLILLVAAGLFVQTLTRLQTKGPGFNASSLVMFRVNPVRSGHSDARARQLMRELLLRLQQVPGVENAAIAGIPLLIGGSWNSNMVIEFDGRIVTDRPVHCNRASPEFFSAIGTRLVAGRPFEQNVAASNGFRNAIINESFARRYFKDRNPVGYRIGLGNRPDTQAGLQIVGVVKDFSYMGLRDQNEQVFFNFWEDPTGNGVFYLRVRGNPEQAFGPIRAAVAEVDPALPVVSLRTVEDQMKRSLNTERMLANVTSGFGFLALLLSVVGLYGVMSFVVTQRTREIGIRMALGATRSTAVWLIIRDALVMICTGTAFALPCVWALSRIVQWQLFGVGAMDGPTIAGASLLLAGVALTAAMLPAWKAASIQPTQALRVE